MCSNAKFGAGGLFGAQLSDLQVTKMEHEEISTVVLQHVSIEF